MSGEVVYFLDAVAAPGRQKTHASAADFATTIARLKAAIEAEQMWVLAELDPQMLLRKDGYAIGPARQIFYFHPRFMSRLLAANASAIVEAPLKFVVMADATGRVVVRHPDISNAFAGYDGLQPVAEDLAAVTARIVQSISA